MNEAVMQEVIKEIKSDDSRDGSYPIRRLRGDNYDFIKGYTMGDIVFFYDGAINGKRCQILYWGKPTAPWMPDTNESAYYEHEKDLHEDLTDDELRFVIQMMFNDMLNHPKDGRDSPVINLQ